MPFGPVDYVYDISDTYLVDGKNYPSLFVETEEEILASIIEPFKTDGYEPKAEMNNLEEYMKYHGIIIDANFNAGNNYAGKIEVLEDYHPKMQIKYKNNTLYIAANYMLSIRDHAQCGEAFATAVHELGHLFCHHLIAVPQKAWEVRHLDHISKEFEAESVSYIVCSRLGIFTPSIEYLKGYCKNNKTIPQISVENIFTACNLILNMIEGISLKQGILYKYDDNFKRIIDNL